MKIFFQRFVIFLLITLSVAIFSYKTFKVNNKEVASPDAVVVENKLNALRNATQNESSDEQKICDIPMLYHMGDVDSRFGISRDIFMERIAEAEKIWEDKMEIDVFEYSADREGLKINLIFDERQKNGNEKAAANQEIDSLSSRASSLDKKYESLEKKYKKNENEYEKDLKEYESDVKKYEDQVDYWNSKGGAPEDEYEKLEKQKKELEDDYEDLEKKRKSLNKTGEDLNDLAEKEGDAINDYKKTVTTYQNKFGSTREFEKGNYSGSGEINIYQFNEMSDLIITLAHELGHARGIGHVDNSKSIMYYLLSDQDIGSLGLSDEDVGGMRQACGLDQE